MIVSLLYQLTRRLLPVPAVLLRRDSTKDAELFVLRHENAVRRRQIIGSFAETSSVLVRSCCGHERTRGVQYVLSGSSVPHGDRVLGAAV